MSEMIKIFAIVFLAEIGDKTQIATMLFATDDEVHPLSVFVAAAAALILATALAVTAGKIASKYLDVIPFNLIAGVGFLIIGVISVLDHFGIDLGEIAKQMLTH